MRPLVLHFDKWKERIFEKFFDGKNEMTINAKLFFWNVTNHRTLRVIANRLAAQFWVALQSSVNASPENFEDPS
jgi:hypothetical protein